MVPQRRAHHEVGKEVAVDLVPYRCAYTPRHVALAMLCLLEVRVQGAVGVPRRRDLRDGRRICAGGCSTAPLRTTSRPRRHVLPDDDAPARSRGRCIWILIMFAREAGELLLCLIYNSQGVEISVPWTFPAAFPTLPTLRPRGVTLKDCQTIGTHKEGTNWYAYTLLYVSSGKQSSLETASPCSPSRRCRRCLVRGRGRGRGRERV